MGKPMTSRDVRRAFKTMWREWCEDHPEHASDKPMMRMEFAMFIDELHREGRISDKVVQRVTLEG